MRAAELLETIHQFIASAKEPALAEPGAGMVLIDPAQVEASIQGAGVRLHIWSEASNLVRRVLAIRDARPGRLELEIERFGKQRGTWLLIDQARASNHAIPQRARRRDFGEVFRAFLRRQFTGWEVVKLSAAGDLHNSFSPAYPRALITQASRAYAAIAAPPFGFPDGALTFGLIWLDFLRQRLGNKTVSLAIFLPEGAELITCLRLRCLNVEAAAFVYDADFYERPIDIRNGNLTSSLDTAQNSFTPLDTPEGRLELALRRNIDLLDGRLLREPVYGQVPAFTGHDRGVLDLLAVESTGRLCVVELKASEDIHLPIQALDYWMRVAAHNERGDFTRYGYFPGIRLSNEPPRVILAAPAMHFHPATHTLLRYYAPQIEVDRAGLAFARQHLPDSLVQSSTNPVRVAFRLHGCDEPWHLTDDAAIPDRRNSKIHRATQPARGG